jgi:hypothetical protein
VVIGGAGSVEVGVEAIALQFLPEFLEGKPVFYIKLNLKNIHFLKTFMKFNKIPRISFKKYIIISMLPFLRNRA